MPHQILFDRLYHYSPLETGITIEAVLRYGNHEVHCPAKIDTGAQHCVFSRELGEDPGLEIERGFRREMQSLAGTLTTYGHEVRLETLGLEFQTVVFFSAARRLPRNLLGRSGWLQLVRLAIVDYDQALYLSAYDSEES